MDIMQVVEVVHIRGGIIKTHLPMIITEKESNSYKNKDTRITVGRFKIIS
jgi:hypothetical protein